MVNVLFSKMRNSTKFLIAILIFGMLGGSILAGGSLLGLWGGQQASAQAAIAIVNGEEISYNTFSRALYSLLTNYEQQLGYIDSRTYQLLEMNALEDLIGEIIVRQEVNKRKIKASKAEVEEAIAEWKESTFGDEETFEQWLSMVGLTNDYLREYFAEDVKITKLQQQITGDIAITEETLKELYEEVRHANETIEVSHILIRADEDNLEEAKTRAEEILAQITPENFAELAKLYGEDGSAEDGGNLGERRRGEFVKEFEEAAFALEAGEISGLVKSQFGYHIIYVSDRYNLVGEYEEEKESLREYAKNMEIQRLMMEWYEELRDNAKVTIKDNKILAFKYYLDGDTDKAIEHYLLAIEERPNDGYLNAALGELYLELERAEDGLEQFKQATAKVTHDPVLFYYLAQINQQLGNLDDAVDAYYSVIELAPNDVYVMMQAANLLNRLERTEEAQELEAKIEEVLAREKELLEKSQQNSQEETNVDQTQDQVEDQVDETSEDSK